MVSATFRLQRNSEEAEISSTPNHRQISGAIGNILSISGGIVGFTRTPPIKHLKIEEKKPEDFLFPRQWQWAKGEQAKILWGFCIANKLPSVKFHALRACFATQLISTGIPATVVMKICGWRDLKTMQRYIRLAGVDEAGATEALRFIPTEEAVMERVVSMYDYRDKK